MLIEEPLDFAKEFIDLINKQIDTESPGKKITRIQGWWLAFCITAVVLTNSVCWARFERFSLGKQTLASISWMFRCSKIRWDRLLVSSIRVVLKFYGIGKGVLVLDDTDHARSKNVTALHKVHKLKDKKTSGYVMGQNLVFLLLVTPKITIPVAFAFYQPDPAIKAWTISDRLLKKQGVAKKKNEKAVKSWFGSYPGVSKTISIRGGDQKAVVMGGARLWVKAHQKKRFVIALRYEGEQDDRYIVATNMTWRMTDIVEAYTLRWLAEVFFPDWKQYEGWCQMAKQPGIDGSNRGLILSLLTEHALLLHPEQKALVKHNLPACTVGSLRERIRFDAIVQFIHHVLQSNDPYAVLAAYGEQIKNTIALAPSGKHLNHRCLGRMEPSPSLKYREAA